MGGVQSRGRSTYLLRPGEYEDEVMVVVWTRDGEDDLDAPLRHSVRTHNTRPLSLVHV